MNIQQQYELNSHVSLDVLTTDEEILVNDVLSEVNNGFNVPQHKIEDLLDIIYKLSKKSIYVLTREINAYEQDDEYFVAAFDHMPTKSELQDKIFDETIIDHVLKGGGRIADEDEWWWLYEYN